MNMLTVKVEFLISAELIDQINDECEQKTNGNLSFADVLKDKIFQLCDYDNRIPFSQLTVMVKWHENQKLS